MLTFLRPGGLACCCSAPFVSAVNSTDSSSALTCHNRKRTSAFWFRRSAIVSVKSPVFTHWLSNLLAVFLSLCQDEIWEFLFYFLNWVRLPAHIHPCWVQTAPVHVIQDVVAHLFRRKWCNVCMEWDITRFFSTFFFTICFMVATNCSATCCM